MVLWWHVVKSTTFSAQLKRWSLRYTSQRKNRSHCFRNIVDCIVFDRFIDMTCPSVLHLPTGEASAAQSLKGTFFPTPSLTHTAAWIVIPSASNRPWWSRLRRRGHWSRDLITPSSSPGGVSVERENRKHLFADNNDLLRWRENLAVRRSASDVWWSAAALAVPIRSDPRWRRRRKVRRQAAGIVIN